MPALPQPFDSTVGGAAANSYVSVAAAESLLQALPVSPGVTEWLAFTDTQKEQTLVAATFTLDALSWVGHICNCEQKLQWPRYYRYDCRFSASSVIPDEILLATAYLAASMGVDGGFTAIQSGGSSTASTADLEPFDEVEIGPIRVKMKEDVTYGDEMTTAIGLIPPFVADLIRRFLNAFGVSEGYMGRRSIARAWGSYMGSPAYSGTMYLRNGMVYPRMGGWASLGMGRRYR